MLRGYECGCSGDYMLLDTERNYGLGMDALVIACPWNTNRIMAWAWMLRGPVCSWNTNRIMARAWMLW